MEIMSFQDCIIAVTHSPLDSGMLKGLIFILEHQTPSTLSRHMRNSPCLAKNYLLPILLGRIPKSWLEVPHQIFWISMCINVRIGEHQPSSWARWSPAGWGWRWGGGSCLVWVQDTNLVTFSAHLAPGSEALHLTPLCQLWSQLDSCHLGYTFTLLQHTNDIV